MKTILLFLFSIQLSLAHALSKEDFIKKNILTQEYNNKTQYIINFWASWCSKCLAKFEKIKSLNIKDKDIKFIALNVGEDISKAKRFLKRKSISHKLIIDSDYKKSKFLEVNQLPTTLVYKNGKIQYIGAKLPQYFQKGLK